MLSFENQTSVQLNKGDFINIPLIRSIKSHGQIQIAKLSGLLSIIEKSHSDWNTIIRTIKNPVIRAAGLECNPQRIHIITTLHLLKIIALSRCLFRYLSAILGGISQLYPLYLQSSACRYKMDDKVNTSIFKDLFMVEACIKNNRNCKLRLSPGSLDECLFSLPISSVTIPKGWIKKPCIIL